MKGKKILALLLGTAMIVGMTACGAKPAATETPAADAGTATETPAADAGAAATDAAPADGASYNIAIVPKAAGNPFNEREAQGFKNAVEGAGFTCTVQYPEAATAEAQITVIETLISQKVDAIAIAANEADALESVIDEAESAGIHVISLDSATNAESRETFINQAGTTEVAQSLCDAVLDLTGGEGQWAILSATSTATNQNAWIDAMNEIMSKDDKYAKLELVDTVYGDDESQKSTTEAQALLKNYPDLKVICSPTTVGMAATAQVLVDANSTVKLTGLGLPSEMASYISADGVCPYMYLWNPIDMGALAGQTCIALLNGDVTGKTGETFTCDLGNGDQTFTVTDAADGGTEIILGAPFEFNADNIADWKDVY